MKVKIKKKPVDHRSVVLDCSICEVIYMGAGKANLMDGPDYQIKLTHFCGGFCTESWWHM